MTDVITGILTDYDLMTEGKFQGYYGARIDDMPYVVMHHVDSFLLRLAKGESVEANLNKDGHISKIQRRKSAPRQSAEEVRPKEEIKKEQQDYNAKAKSYGFGEPTPGPSPEAQKNIDKANAEGDQRIAENAAYLKDLAAGKNQDTCTSPEKPTVTDDGITRIVAETKARNAAQEPAALVPVQQFHPVAPPVPREFSKDQIALIKATVARGCTDTEFELLMYLSAQYQLDPIRRQIWAVKYGTAPASIFTGRDGFLEIAHRSGVFDGMESGVKKDGDQLVGWCKVYRKDMSHAFYVEVYESEYTTHKNLWQTKPRIMIQKVAESSCLRRAFSVSGLYCPEEMPEQPGVQ